MIFKRRNVIYHDTLWNKHKKYNPLFYDLEKKNFLIMDKIGLEINLFTKNLLTSGILTYNPFWKIFCVNGIEFSISDIHYVISSVSIPEIYLY